MSVLVDSCLGEHTLALRVAAEARARASPVPGGVRTSAQACAFRPAGTQRAGGKERCGQAARASVPLSFSSRSARSRFFPGLGAFCVDLDSAPTAPQSPLDSCVARYSIGG